MSDRQTKLLKNFISKGGKVKSYAMSQKRDVVKFTQEYSINLAASRFIVDRKRIAEWIRSIEALTSQSKIRLQRVVVAIKNSRKDIIFRAGKYPLWSWYALQVIAFAGTGSFFL